MHELKLKLVLLACLLHNQRSGNQSIHFVIPTTYVLSSLGIRISSAHHLIHSVFLPFLPQPRYLSSSLRVIPTASVRVIRGLLCWRCRLVRVDTLTLTNRSLARRLKECHTSCDADIQARHRVCGCTPHRYMNEALTCRYSLLP